MELTHAQAREMIQFDADSALNAYSLRILKSHLASCEACRLYADSIHTMEVRLRHTMTQRWNLRPNPLVISAIKNPKPTQSAQMATRFAVTASVILMFVVVTLGITRGARIESSPQPPLGVPLIPTPSMQTTSTLAGATPSCEQIKYMVQPNDTLESIAEQFLITKEDLMKANNIPSGTMVTGTEIIIPMCNSTPTGTVHPPTFTTTITPLTEVISRTPDG